MSLSETSPERLTLLAQARSKGTLWATSVLALIVVISLTLLGWYWSREPATFDVMATALKRAQTTTPQALPRGFVYASTLTEIAETLLYKSGGYLTNDVTPPSVFLDNIDSWEFGALVMLRDASSALRNHFARSQSQSKEDPDLAKAEPYFYYENNSWVLPSTEAEYEKGIVAMEGYIARLKAKKAARHKAVFYARGDNLSQYLQIVEKRLGDLSHRLSSSTFQMSVSLDSRRTITGITPWLLVDDIFFEARGASWALLHIMKSIEFEFRSILEEKHGLETIERIIQEFENAQIPILSPVVLNGNGFGLFANYSLTMANYITRANAATLDLRDLMRRG